MGKKSIFLQGIENWLWIQMENHLFPAHFTLRVTSLEVVAAETAPAGILVTKGIHLSALHSHQWVIFSCFSNAAPSDKQLIGRLCDALEESSLFCVTCSQQISTGGGDARKTFRDFISWPFLGTITFYFVSSSSASLCEGRKRGWALKSEQFMDTFTLSNPCWYNL